MQIVYEFDKNAICIRKMTMETALQHYSDDVLLTLQQDGSAYVDNDIEIYLEGCYHPAIVLTLDK